jgi:hypothetical protein
MSMIGNYRRLTEAQLAALKADPEKVADFLYAQEPPTGMHLNIDKTWHAIHFLLIGKKWEGGGALFDAVLGGAVLGEEDVGYGPARYLTVDEVAAVANALDEITPIQLTDRFDAKALNDADIYPQGWQSDGHDQNYIRSYYTHLVEFFRAAASSNDAMLLYIN